MPATIKIGKTAVGLFGLEAAVSKLKSLPESDTMPPAEAARKLLDIIGKKNYIPASARDLYLEALAGVWMEKHAPAGRERKRHLEIRILGPGCESCNRLEKTILSILDQKNIAADIHHVKDLDSIWRYEVFHTPALVINDEVLFAGRIPSRVKLENWIVELAEECSMPDHN